MHTALLALGGGVAVLSYLDLVVDMSRGKFQSLATRLAVCFAFTLNCVSTIVGHGGPGDITLAVVYATCSVVAVAITGVHSRDLKHIATFDMICLAISLIGTLVSVVSGKSEIGIGYAIAADVAAYIPTIKACWSKPALQPYRTYIVGAVAALIALFTDCQYGGIHVSSAFTLYLIAIDCGLPALMYYRKRVLKGAPEQVLVQ